MAGCSLTLRPSLRALDESSPLGRPWGQGCFLRQDAAPRPSRVTAPRPKPLVSRAGVGGPVPAPCPGQHPAQPPWGQRARNSGQPPRGTARADATVWPRPLLG